MGSKLPAIGTDCPATVSRDTGLPLHGKPSSRLRYRTIADELIRKKDNFQLLRFIAAANVIYHHAYTIAGGSGPANLFDWLGWWRPAPYLDVDLFFVMSGFLVTASFVRTKDVAVFLWARFLRILPGLFYCLVVTACVIGPIFTERNLDAYFRDPGVVGYVVRNIQMRTDWLKDLPGVFVDNPQKATVNGSIWTMPALARMYACVAILGFLGILSKKRRFNVVVGSLLILVLWFDWELPLLPGKEYARMALMFAAGAFVFVNRSWLPMPRVLLLSTIAAAFLLRSTDACRYLFSAAEVMFVFWFAYGLKWYGFNRIADYSYGIYLWGYPSQQMVAAIDGRLPCWANAAIGFILALLLAIGSWHLVEKPALRMKGVIPALKRRMGFVPASNVATESG